MELSYQADIRATTETVFNLVSDIENLGRWMDNLKESKYISGFDPGHAVGTKFRQRAAEMGQEVEYEGEIINYEKPHRFGVRAGNKDFSLEMHYHLTTTAEGTRLEYHAEMVKASFKIRLLATAFVTVVEKTMEKQMKNLQRLAEAT